MCKDTASFRNAQIKQNYFVMKRLGVLLVGLCCMLLVLGQPKSYISVWGEAGESSLLTTLTNIDTKSSFGVGGGIGGGYEMHLSNFVWTAGLHIGIMHTSFKLGNINDSFDAVDDEGDALLYTYTQNNRRDNYTGLSLQVPVMVGADFGRIYFLAGVKVDVSMLGRSKVKTRLSSSGDYYDLIDPFTGMPEHGYFDDVTFDQKADFKFRPDVMASAELGVNFGLVTKEMGFDVPKKKQIFRLALFADYGLLDKHNPGRLESITLPTKLDASKMSEGITVNNILSTTQSTKEVHNLLVGVKFTVLFKLPDHEKCVICEYDPPLVW